MKHSTYSPCNTNRTLDYLHAHLYEMIFSFGKTEGLGYTYFQTEALLANDDAKHLSHTETITILNLHDAFDFLFANWQYPVELGTVLDYNALIGANDLEANAGEIREDYEIHISGVDYIPSAIYGDEAKAFIDEGYELYSNAIRRAIYFALIINKRQFCCNGNKRTALMVCNHALVHDDCGYVFAPVYYDPNDGTMFDKQYVNVLMDYYDDAIDLDQAIDEMEDFLILVTE